jgi:lipopolysaccharide export LptBFGC system permease protein LptF
MRRARGRSWGITLGIAVFMVYYILLFVSDSLGETDKLNPVLAMWIPNMVLGATTLILLWRAARDT